MFIFSFCTCALRICGQSHTAVAGDHGDHGLTLLLRGQITVSGSHPEGRQPPSELETVRGRTLPLPSGHTHDGGQQPQHRLEVFADWLRRHVPRGPSAPDHPPSSQVRPPVCTHHRDQLRVSRGLYLVQSGGHEKRHERVQIVQVFACSFLG